MKALPDIETIKENIRNVAKTRVKTISSDKNLPCRTNSSREGSPAYIGCVHLPTLSYQIIFAVLG
jgi:hypothetical protein